MAVNLRKPTLEAIAKPDVMLALLMSYFEAIQEMQLAATRSSIVNLGALTEADPGPPPRGVVYQYTFGGSYYIRTQTAAYQVAL